MSRWKLPDLVHSKELDLEIQAYQSSLDQRMMTVEENIQSGISLFLLAENKPCCSCPTYLPPRCLITVAQKLLCSCRGIFLFLSICIADLKTYSGMRHDFGHHSEIMVLKY